MNKIKDRINDEIFIEVCKTSLTMNEASRKLGINYKSLKTRAKELNCFLPNPSGKGTKKPANYKYDLEDVLTKGSITSTSGLRNRLLKQKIKEYICEKCKLTEWNNEKISLELHHIDGDRTNNSLENLQLLCPNCHSQTDNFRSKKMFNYKQINNIDDINQLNIPIKKEKIKKLKEIKQLNICLNCDKETKRDKYCSNECRYKYNSKNIPNIEQLLEDFKELNSYIQVGKKYNVSDNAVKKWIIKYNIENLIKDIKENKKFNNIICDKEFLIEKYKELKSLEKICLVYHIGKNTLREYIKENNIIL